MKKSSNVISLIEFNMKNLCQFITNKFTLNSKLIYKQESKWCMGFLLCNFLFYEPNSINLFYCKEIEKS